MSTIRKSPHGWPIVPIEREVDIYAQTFRVRVLLACGHETSYTMAADKVAGPRKRATVCVTCDTVERAQERMTQR